jgi:hypothetical protein
MLCNDVCMRIMHRLLDNIDMFLVGDGTNWAVTRRLQ